MDKGITIKRLKELFHKPGVDPSDWDNVHPNLLSLGEYLIEHCHTHNLPLVITSIIRPKIPGVSKSDTHAEGRAFDISVRGWSYQDIHYLRNQVNKIFKVGAFSLRDGLERECVYETGKNGEGTAAHLHFQVRRTKDFTWPKSK